MSTGKLAWAKLSHHEKYKLLQQNRVNYCQQVEARRKDVEKELEIDGKLILDIPSFYLALGESINGVNGYFGTCTMSLRDCLDGGFGIKPPVKITIVHSENLEKNLNYKSFIKYWLEGNLYALESYPSASLEQLKDWGILSGREEDEEEFSYLEELKRVIYRSGSKLLLK